MNGQLGRFRSDRAVAAAAESLAHLTDYARTGDQHELDQALAARRRAVALTSADDPDFPELLAGLADVLSRTFDATGRKELLEEARVLHKRAVRAAMSADDPQRPRVLLDVGTGLLKQGTEESLAEAAETLREVMELTPIGGATHRRAATDLAAVLVNLWAKRQDLHDWELLGLGEPAWGSGLLSTRVTGQAGELDEAIALLERAVDQAPPDDAAHHATVALLGATLRVRSTMTGHGETLDHDIEVLRATVAGTAEGDPALAVACAYLAETLADRWGRSGHVRDRDAAVAEFRAAVSVEPAAPLWRARVARRWGAFMAQEYGPAAAAQAFATAVRLLDEAAARGVTHDDQERVLTEFPGLASDAAACAIAAGSAERAVELLEQGRAVLLAQILDTRPPHEDARPPHEDARPPHEDARPSHDDIRPPHDGARTSHEDARTPRDDARRYDLPEPLSFARLRAAAECGPVLVVNVSAYRCDVLAVTTAGVHLIPLPEVTAREVTRTAAGFVAAPAARGPATLAWLRERIGAPAMTALGLDAPPAAGQPWPRLWWCPTGALSLLPLHAVALDVAASSYTPTLRALIRTREQAAPTAGGRPLIVAMPRTPGLDDLPGAEDEVRVAAALMPDAMRLTGPEATAQAVLAELASSPWAHFACHAGQDPAAPAQGALHLHDGPLTVRELAAARLDRAEFAFLSGCATSSGGGLPPDECLSLPATVQLAGYPGVIGTLWPVGEPHGPAVVEAVYAMMTAGGTRAPDPSAAAVALHLAVRALRADHPDAPHLWAPFVHFGP